MIDLLGTNDKKMVLAEYQKRLALGYGIALCVILLVAIISIGSFYTALSIEKHSLGQTLAGASSGSGAKEFDAFSAQVGQADGMMKMISSDQQSVHSITTVLDEAIKARPASVKIFSFDLVEADTGNWNLKLDGRSLHRQDLLSFTDNLKKSTLFQKVDSPFSNLIKDANSDFSITLTMIPLRSAIPVK